MQAIFLLGIIVAPTLGPDARRLDHRQLHLELVLLHQRADRHRVDVPGRRRSSRIRPGSARHRAGSTGSASACSRSASASLQYVLEEGNQKDWFADALILRLGDRGRRSAWWRCSGGSSRRATRIPVVNFRVLKNRDLAASIFLFVALGFGLYGGVFIFPLFTQTHSATSRRRRPAWRCCRAASPRRRRRSICGRLLNGAQAAGRPADPHLHRRGALRRARCGTWATSRRRPASRTCAAR